MLKKTRWLNKIAKTIRIKQAAKRFAVKGVNICRVPELTKLWGAIQKNNNNK